MAVSRKAADSTSLPYLDPAALHAIGQALSLHAQTVSRVAVACSGGTDSAMLAVHAAHWAAHAGVQLHLFHVHHGLQTPADEWRERVHSLAALLGVPCHSVRTRVDTGRGTGTEAAARTARYDAFAALARFTSVQHVVLAHHLNDQAETVLLRLLRGAGPTGLAAMRSRSERAGVVYLRPWLDVPRSSLIESAARFALSTGWHAVQDPTNSDPRYTRSAVRTLLAPALEARWPGWSATLARHARQSDEAAQVLDEVAHADLQALDPGVDGLSFSLQRWRSLSAPRQSLVLRYWLGTQGVRMPSEARLNDWMRQLRGLHANGHDRHMQLHHEGSVLRCVKGRVVLECVGNVSKKDV